VSTIVTTTVPATATDDRLELVARPAHDRTVSQRLIGRDLEVGRVAEFLDGKSGAGCLVLVGEPGIGKTTLWEEGLELARSRGFVVLTTRASESEATLSFAALGDLVSEAGQDALASLPAPQLRALEVALRIADPEGAPPDPLAISAGFLGTLRALANDGRVLIAIDDVQWLDESSTDPILFAARRVIGQSARVLLSRRPGAATPLEHMLLPGTVEHLELAGLSTGAVSRLLVERLGFLPPRRELRRLHETAKGNPLFSLELGRMLIGSKSSEISADLPVPRLVDDVFGYRVRGLTAPVGRAVLAVSLSPGLRRSELSTIVDVDAIEDAVAAGLVTVDGSRVRPSHPLLATAARQHSTARQRRELHLGLASATSEQTLRARHLALATITPDLEVAREVAAAAELAAQRGAMRETEELCAHALRLTPRGAPGRTERILALARGHLNAGDLDRASHLLVSHMGEIPPGRDRAFAQIMLGESAEMSEERRLLDLALVEAPDSEEVRALVFSRQSMLLAVNDVVQLDVAEELARKAMSSAPTPARDIEERASTSLAWVLALRGRAFDELPQRDLSRRIGMVLYDAAVERPWGVRLAFRGEIDCARAVFDDLVAQADNTGELRTVIVMSIQLGELALRCGNAAEAAQFIEEVGQWIAMDEVVIANARLRAQLAAITGPAAEVRRWAEAVYELRQPSRWEVLVTSHALGLASLLDNRPDEAVQTLSDVWDHTRNEGIDDPGAFPVAPDLVEALVLTGDTERALEVTEYLQHAAADQAHPWAEVTSNRCLAMVSLAHGYDESAAKALRVAAEDYLAMGLVFDAARSLLTLGRVERRFKKQGAARQTLAESAALFDRYGCTGWGDHARAELARVSGRRCASDGLTVSERQVAALAAAGLSNKEIAARLFLSINTVESHLRHAFRKLGVRSRAQLAPQLNEE
jgi:DNA-binding CsgD family transcriptional regulator